MDIPNLGGFYQEPNFDPKNPPEGWKFQDGVISYGDDLEKVGALDANQYSLYLQAQWLEREGANHHPLITETRTAIDWEESWDKLAGRMVKGTTALQVLAAYSGDTVYETLDNLTFHRPNFPDIRDSLMAFWRNVCLHGVGVFHLERFLGSIEPTSVDNSMFKRDEATRNLLNHPVNFLNCLNAARLYTHPYPIAHPSYPKENPVLSGRPNNPFSEDVTAFQHDALRVLGGTQVQERPFATWYLLSLSGIERSGIALTQPLLEAAAGVADEGTISTLNRINNLVGRLVGDNWDNWTRHLNYLDIEDTDGRIAGALEYGATEFYSWRRHEHDEENYYSEEDTYECSQDYRELRKNAEDIVAEVKALAASLQDRPTPEG